MRAMKDSGIAWIGEIPEEWKICKIKQLADQNEENSFVDGDWIESPYIMDSGIRYLTTGNIGDGVFKEQGNGFISLRTFEKLSCKYAFPGDLIFSRLNAPYGRSCILPSDFTEYVVAVDNVILRTQEDKRYICYVSQCDGYKQAVDDEAKGTTMRRISRTNLGNIVIPLPPIQQQRPIADYLDRKCGQIDAIIARQQEVIEKLKAYKLSVITEAVTKGLNPHAPMKDSGVEWIGEIPEQWTKVRLKNICQFINGDRSSNYPSPNEYVDEGIPFLGADSLYGRYVDIIQSKKITKEKYHSMGGAKIQKGDILYTLRGSTIGKNALSTFDEGTVASSLMVIRPTSLLSNFLLYWLNSEEEFQQRQSYINGSTAPNLSAENVGSFIMFLPSKVEQQEIADYLDKKCAEIESTILKKQMLVEWLGKYKKSLIYEVVTGKKEV